MFKIIAIVLLTLSVYSLHAGVPISHAQATQTNSTVADINQNYSSAEFAQIQGEVNSIKDVLTAKDDSNLSFLIKKCEQIAAGLSVLQKTLQKYNLAVNRVNPICPSVSSFNRTEIRRYITYIEEKVHAMQDYKLACSNCSSIARDIQEIRNMTRKQIKLINQTLDGQFCNKTVVRSQKAVGFVNLNESFFKSNLNAKNWYYGSTTASDYRIYLFKRSSLYNLTNCPLDTPFVKDYQQICFNCPEGSIFDLGSQSCDTCLPDQILNIDSGSCDKCYGQKKFIDDSLVCFPCDISAGQLLNVATGKCETCPTNHYLEVQTLSCQKMNCSRITPKFNLETKKCEACGISQVVNLNNITQCIKTNFVAICPSDTPLYNYKNFSCVACPANTAYDSSTNQCLGLVKSHKSLKIVGRSIDV